MAASLGELAQNEEEGNMIANMQCKMVVSMEQFLLHSLRADFSMYI